MRALGIAFSLLVFVAAAYAFSPRPLPRFPATGIAVHSLLLLDGVRAGHRVVAAGERGYVFLSDDEGRSWRSVATPTQSTLTALHFHDATRGWAVGHDAVILRTVNGGETWQQVHSAPDEQQPLLDVWFEDESHGYAMGAYGSFYETADGGKRWQARKIVDGDTHFNAMAKSVDGKRYIAGEAGTLVRSEDGGRTFAPLPSPYKGSLFGVLGLKGGGALAFGLRGRIFRSTDSGSTWEPADARSQASLMGGAVLDEGPVVLVGQDGTVLTSRDDGRTFTLQKSATGRSIAAVVAAPSRELLLFGESGVARAGAPAQ
jgi:photosystem II stability/assembly factor-like uncharacterized protein